MTITPAFELDDIVPIVRSAEKAVMSVYNDPGSMDISFKSDTSPVTTADIQSHNILIEGLSRLDPGIPIVSEEQDSHISQRNMQADMYWLIDPIDGTKEFIAHNGQFTICVALIKHKRPLFGIVSAPAFKLLYYGGKPFGSYKVSGNSQTVQLTQATPEKIVYGSISHSNDATKQYINENYADCSVQPVGSQLKFVYVADSKAVAYPRIGSTMKIWDIAAGHAILEGVGGSVERPDGSTIFYGGPSLLAGDFVAYVKK